MRTKDLRGLGRRVPGSARLGPRRNGQRPARHAVEMARERLKDFERDEDRKGLQRKVTEQRRVINRLEAKLRAREQAPYAEQPTEKAGQ